MSFIILFAIFFLVIVVGRTICERNIGETIYEDSLGIDVGISFKREGGYNILAIGLFKIIIIYKWINY